MKNRLIALVRQNKLIFLLVIFAAYLRFSNLSPWLEDWDSVQLALGLHHYSVTDHQPHPPGYPIYIILGRLFNVFTQNDVRALTSLSALLGSLSIIPLYLLTKNMFDKKTAVLSSLIFIVTPVHWVFSERAFTDIPGLFFLLAFGYFIYSSRGNPKKLLLSSLFAGLILGVRFNEIPVVLGLITLVTLIYGNIRFFLLSISAFLIGVALWLVPLVFITEPSKFITSFSSLADYVVKHDVFLGGSFSFNTLLKYKFEQLIYLFDLSYTKGFLILSLFSFIWVTLKFKLREEFKIQFLLTWIMSYGAILLLVYNLEIQRHLLPLLPPLAILAALLFVQVVKNKAALVIAFSLLWVGVFSQGLQQVIRLNSEVPPTIQPVSYVKQNFNPSDTVVIASFTYRQFQYYAPEFNTYNSGKTSLLDIKADQKVIIDYPGLTNKILEPDKFEIKEVKEFKGDKEIFPKISQITLYILEHKDER